MFRIESYVTPILLSYVDKYVKDFKPADAQVSLWGGGVVLHNLVLKEDVLQQGVSLPFRLISGRIHELHIQVPWTKIMSEPIVVTINTIECVLSLNTSKDDATQMNNEESHKPVVETPPGYMQALVRRIVSNIAVKVHHLILKYVDDDIVLSLNVKQMSIESVAPDWTPAFTDISQIDPILRRLVQLDDLTLCLDQTDSDGKIRIYQEPLLYRCQLTFRLLTRLVSATTRRAQYLDIQMRSSKLAWGVTSDQLLLLLRLGRERASDETISTNNKSTPTSPKSGQSSSTFPTSTTTNQMENSRRESWSDWAWSWLPSWSDREGGLEEAPLSADPVSLHFAAHLDSVSLVYKAMELEHSNKKRARAILELNAECFAIKSSICCPTLIHFSLGMKYLKLQSQGKCICGHIDSNTIVGEATMYILRSSDINNANDNKWPDDDDDHSKSEQLNTRNASQQQNAQMASYSAREEGQSSEIPNESENNINENICRNYMPFWQNLGPIFYLEYNHERTPSTPYLNPYDNPPTDFEYSDWREQCSVNLKVEPIQIRICMGLIHRVSSIISVLNKVPPVPERESSMRVLTVEECEALSENLPCRTINIDLKNLRIGLHPWDHSSLEQPVKTPLVLYMDIPKSNYNIVMPLYPHRVCNAACQLQSDDTPLSRGSRLHFTSNMGAVQISVANPQSSHLTRPVARIDFQVVVHVLLHQNYFTKPNTVLVSYLITSKEISIGGSSARLQAAYQVIKSLINHQYSPLLRCSTLARDALNDQEAAIIDLTSEDLTIKGFLTRTTTTHVIALHTAKATVLHAPDSGEVKQAWLFSAPDIPTTSSYLRIAVQLCKEPKLAALNYIGVWSEPMAVCIDPLFVAWLAYRPQQIPGRDSPPTTMPKAMPSTSHTTRPRSIQPTIGRVPPPPSRSGSGSELVHTPRPRSQASGSGTKPSNASTAATVSKETMWEGKNLIKLYTRLKKILVNIEVGFIVVYITPNSASALDCATVRDALERHTAAGNKVFVASLGRFSMHSNLVNKQLWREVRYDGPTFLPPTHPKPEVEDSFPWRIRFADVTCYTLHIHVSDRNIDKNRSQLKVPSVIAPKTVLDLFTTTVTLSVVTKCLALKKDKGESTKHESPTEMKVKYFTQGLDFKPTTLKEFIRGPAQRNKDTQNDPNKAGTSTEKEGPLVCIGVCLYADTPPILFRLDQDQCDVVVMAMHNIGHLLSLFRQEPLQTMRPAGGSQGGSSRSVKRSISEMDELVHSNSDTRSEQSAFIPLYESPIEPGVKVKTSFWFQWVTHRITLVTTSSRIMFTFNAEDIISTVDLQTNYNQFKIKIASASVKYHEWGYNEWASGVLEGRVLEGRESTASAAENQFLVVTVTQAEVATLPLSWKEELHPKLLEKSDTSTIWEIYASVAPLEGLLTPNIMRSAAVMLREFRPMFVCPLSAKSSISSNRSLKWPYCYINFGGIRILLNTQNTNLQKDDTIVISVSRIYVNPHPDNPIMRRTSTSNEGVWLTASGGPEGRQYEMIVNSVTVQSAQFSQLVNSEVTSFKMSGTGTENPALLWAQPPVPPVLTTILHPLKLSCIFAPPLYVGDTLASELALELNLISDCDIDIGVSQLRLLKALVAEINVVVKLGFQCASDSSVVQCAYATMILTQENLTPKTSEEKSMITGETSNRSKLSYDSDFESARSGSNSETGKTSRLEEINYKKSASVAFADETAEASDNIELYVTVGNVRMTLYIEDSNSPLLACLRPPSQHDLFSESNSAKPKRKKEKINKPKSIDSLSGTMNSTDEREVKAATSTTDLLEADAAKSRPIEGILPFVTITLQQPNMYYWKKRAQKSLQVSLFNAWVGLGSSPSQGGWNLVLFHTEKGQADPVTGIPPALLTLKLLLPVTAGNFNASNVTSRGSLSLNIERPIMVETSIDRIKRLKYINHIIQLNLGGSMLQINTSTPKPPLFKIRKFMMDQGIENIKVRTCQIGAQGCEGVMGWDECCLQIIASSRFDRLLVKGLMTALQVTAALTGDNRRPLLHPLMLGIDAKINWEAWQRAEGGNVPEEPITSLRVDFDRITLDLVPDDLKALNRIANATTTAFNLNPSKNSATSLTKRMSFGKTSMVTLQTQTKFKFPAKKTSQLPESSDHYYKDDLRSGAFKIVTGDQFPMAYQIMLQKNAIAWRYPHPRAITQFIAFPLPNQNEEVQCVLEYYSSTLSRWEPHTWFKLPIAEAREVAFSIMPPDAVYASIWRFRTCNKIEESPTFAFDSQYFNIGKNNAAPGKSQNLQHGCMHTGVSPQALSGALRVDSYFAPKHLPRCKLAVQVASLDLHLHNELPSIYRGRNSIKGYYITKQQSLKSHRIMSLVTRDNVVQAFLGCSAGKMVMLHTKVSSDMMESSTGLMERFVHECRVQAAVALPDDVKNFRLRMCSTPLRASLHLPRLQTLKSQVNIWHGAVSEFRRKYMETTALDNYSTTKPADGTSQIVDDLPTVLEGLISLWVKNDCSFSIRMGQESTEEYALLPPGTTLAYRWRNPEAPRRLRFSLETDNTVVQWSESVSFQDEESQVRIIKNTETPSANLLSNVYMHTRVEKQGVKLCMRLFGKLQLVNMLRKTLAYKIRARHFDSPTWVQLTSGELNAESLNTTVLCTTECELTLKIKFAQQKTYWSGEIPLKECPKQNLPWLVKIPCEGDTRYMAVWCRVVRGRNDGRILATIWPLYMLQSHLSLDIDVLIITTMAPSVDPSVPPPLVQSASGRGLCTHLIAPGTTSAKHTLVLRYRNLETPVTRDVIPLNYGMTDTSVFEKRVAVKKIDEVIAEIAQWLNDNKNNRPKKWPYSCVTSHWSAQWVPALFQPRSDINVTYCSVRAGGGCSLEVQLRPVAMFCNAAPLALMLRSHNAAPLCKIEPGAVIAAPSVILSKPFFVSVEMAHSMYTSIKLELCPAEPDLYVQLPPGRVALDRPTDFTIDCNQKVVMLTLFYEWKEEISVFGVTSTYRLINRLGTRILVAGVVMPRVANADAVMKPRSFEIVEPDAAGPGTPLSKFWLNDQWEDVDINNIAIYLWIALPDATGTSPGHTPVPIVLRKCNVRNAFALKHSANRSMPVAVTQQILNGCVVITLADDPYPQFYIQNYTQISLLVGEPLYVPPDDCSWSRNKILPECPGLKWYCCIESLTATHYSTPTHCKRHPAIKTHCQSPRKLPFLAFAKKSDDFIFWSPPTAITDGEQLVQVPGLRIIKMRITMHPHSTLIELQNVNHNDISASDIRRRLQGTSSEQVLSSVSSFDNTLDLSKALNQIQESDMFIHHTFEPSVESELNQTEDAAADPNNTNELRFDSKMDSEEKSSKNFGASSNASGSSSTSYQYSSPSTSAAVNLRSEDSTWPLEERVRCVLEGLVLSLASSQYVPPLFVAHVDRVAVHMTSTQKGLVVKTSVAAIQVDNREYENGQYDFAVVAVTRRSARSPEHDRWPFLTNMFGDRDSLPLCTDDVAALLRTNYDSWTVGDTSFTELTEVELQLSPLALYIEDAYVTALAALIDCLKMPNRAEPHDGDAVSSIRPYRLRFLHIHSLDLNLTLHTAVRMYIALDQSPLHLTEFKLHDLIITNGRLMHELTVHYLSAAVLAAGWVVGGLELLGAPGALAARVGNATGGVRGVAYTIAAALLRSVSAWAGSLARNLDLLAGDEEHTRRAAANRRNPPQSLFSGLLFGLTNLAVNMLGAVGGIAHHPLVAAAEGESSNATTGLRRGLVGALTKPLSATADLLAFAGHGLLHQTGWQPLPQIRPWTDTATDNGLDSGWQRECVRWAFRLIDLQAIAGYRVLLNDTPVLLLLTPAYLIVADPDTEKILEILEFRNCLLAPYRGPIIELTVRRGHSEKDSNDAEENNQYQINMEAMTRVARYTGALNSYDVVSVDERCVRLLSPSELAHALYTTLTALTHTNSSSHFRLF